MSTLREYELVNSSSVAEMEHSPSQDDDDGVWRVTNKHVATAATLQRRKRRLASLVCLLVVVIIVVLVCNGSRSSNEDAPSAVNSNQQEQDQATEASTAPTASSTSSPTDTHKEDQVEGYHCKGDRIQNGVKLKTNHYICDHYKRYRFGMNEKGSLIYADDALHTTVILYNGTVAGDYFELLRDGNLTVYNSANNNVHVVWQEPCSDDVSFSPECLPTNHETYDCPYLHLHSGGTIVLNWISSTNDEWKERNILHMYNLNRNCKDHFVCQP